MDRTNFAGLTALLPDDPLTTDNASFLSRNVYTTDHFIAIGAKYHHHDGRAGLAQPVTGPAVVAQPGSGTIDPGTVGYFALTLVDVDGGETLVSAAASAVTPNPFPAPVQPPSAHVDYTGGTLRADTYYYGVSLLDGVGGETTLSPQATVNRDPGFASGQVVITNLDALLASAPGATGWAIYRAAAGGQWAYLATGAGASYTDTGVDCVDCLREPPIYNTTRKTTRFVVTLPPTPAGVSAQRLYGGVDPDFPSPALVGTFAAASAATVVVVPSMAFGLGTPPPVSTSVGGADRINPATDIQTPVSISVPGSGMWASAGSGWPAPSVAVMAGLVDLEGVWVGSGKTGDVIGVVPSGARPRAKYPLDGLVVASARGARVPVDVLTTGQLVLAAALASGASAAVSIGGRWRL